MVTSSVLIAIRLYLTKYMVPGIVFPGSADVLDLVNIVLSVLSDRIIHGFDHEPIEWLDVWAAADSFPLHPRDFGCSILMHPMLSCTIPAVLSFNEVYLLFSPFSKTQSSVTHHAVTFLALSTLTPTFLCL